MPEAIKPFLKPEIIWFVVGLVMLIFEFMLPGLIIGFFGVGAVITAIVCMITDVSLNTQLIIFIASSVLSLLILRRWLKGIFLGHMKATQEGTEDIDEFVGQHAVVKEKIVPRLGGKVELHGTNWQAEADGEIPEGAVVEVVSKDNLTLKVKAL